LWFMPVILPTSKAEIGNMEDRSQLGETVCETPISQITRVKCTRGVAQAVERLLCNLKGLVQTPVPQKKKSSASFDFRKKKSQMRSNSGLCAF
jgi:hypothetical protein